ncbi:SU10 major capsid protein [Burkholderia cepacia]|uniref:SU10 major capsid protein n=1 Tax=Burkholderia cepacia TaxID=292 RepID=UPI00158E0046|nr:DUF5309 family protein [Burkholderia cepacia]
MPSNTVTTYATVGNREDLIDKVFMISPTDTPFVSAISQTGATAIYHEWQTDSLAAPANVALVEGADATYSAQTPTVRLGNYSQIVGDTFSVSNTQEAVKHAGPNQIARLQAKKMMELKKNIEKSALLNATSATGSSSVARQMKGVLGWNSSNYIGGSGGSAPVAGNPGTAPVAGTAQAYTETLLKQALQEAYIAGGNVDMLILTPAGKQVQSSFTGNITRMQDVNNDGKVTLKTSYTIYQSDFGEVTCVPNRVITGATEVFGIDTDMWSLAVLRGMETEEMATVGDARQFQIRWEGTLEARNQASSFTIADLNNV